MLDETQLAHVASPFVDELNYVLIKLSYNILRKFKANIIQNTLSVLYGE